MGCFRDDSYNFPFLNDELHPGRLTAGTYSHHPFRKENDLQTSRELCSMLCFRGCKVLFIADPGNDQHIPGNHPYKSPP